MQVTKLTFKQTQVRLTKYDKITFVIGNIKMRNKIGIAYFKFYAYDIHGSMMQEESSESDKWIITTEYTTKMWSFYILSDMPVDSYVIELYIGNATSENPVYMNHLMLTNKEYIEYHQPQETKKDVEINFKNNNYVNLYTENEEYLQVIRPYGDKFTTNQLTTSQKTILVPHLPSESEYDNPTNIVYEYMMMNDQSIRIER